MDPMTTAGIKRTERARSSAGAGDSVDGRIERRDLSDQDSVRCEVCEREVPVDEARSVEGRDIVWHFCGMDCFEEWRRVAERGANSNLL